MTETSATASDRRVLRTHPRWAWAAIVLVVAGIAARLLIRLAG